MKDMVIVVCSCRCRVLCCVVLMWLVLFWLILSLLCPLLLLLQLVGQVSPVDPVVDGWLVGIFRASSPSAFSCRFSLCLPPSKQNEKQRERDANQER